MGGLRNPLAGTVIGLAVYLFVIYNRSHSLAYHDERLPYYLLERSRTREIRPLAFEK